MYSILYEDEHFLLVNKASGVLVHKTKYEEKGTLIELILESKGECYLVNRIDRYTSGVIILAKSKEALRKVKDLFTKEEVKKVYLAIVTKELPAKRLKITLSLERSRGKKLRFRASNQGKRAWTEVRVISKNFIEVLLKTGRTHQIRAHLYEIGCPVLNDPLYGGNVFNPEFGQYLHSYRVSFICPISGKLIDVKADLPIEFQDKLKELEIDAVPPEDSWAIESTKSEDIEV